MKIIFAVITTIVLGFVATGLGHAYMNARDLGPIVAVAIMGAFILSELKKSKSD